MSTDFGDDNIRKLREAGPIIGEQRKARRIAAEDAKKQQTKIEQQQRAEKNRLAVAEGEVERRKAIGAVGKRGRRSLIRTSEKGLPTNLGGSNAV